MIVGEVAGQNAAQVAFAENQNVIQTLAPDRADEPLREGILPWAVRGREDFLDPHALHSVPKLFAVDLVTVAQEIGGRGVVRKGIHDLLGGPVGGGMLGHVEVDDAPAVVSEHDENKEDAQARGWHREEIEGDQIADMVGEERPPGLRRQGAPLRYEPRDGALGDVEPQPEKFPVNSRGAPQRIGRSHPCDESLDLNIDGGRPAMGRAESLAQYSRKRRRCHRRTVLGDTMTRACLQPTHTLDSATQKRRSLLRTFGRVTVLL